MPSKILKLGTLGVIAVLSLTLLAGGDVLADNETTAKELATLLRTAREFISESQEHIDNPSIGDKGLIGDMVVATVKENYRAVTGKSLPEGFLHLALLEAIAKTMDANQNLINEKGKRFKNFLPAIFAKAVADNFKKTSDGKATIKLTAPKEFIRNLSNRPDAWENAAIEEKFKNPAWLRDKAFIEENISVKSRKAFRLILPEYYSRGCLRCHGEPKGEIDMTGGEKEGGKLGELGGAISVVIFQ